MKYVCALAIALILNAGANLALKIGMKSVESGGGLFSQGISGAVAKVAGTPAVLAGLAMFAMNAAFYMYALQSRSMPISVAYPVMVGGGYAMIATVAALHPSLAESISSGQKAGIGLIFAGIVLIAASAKS